MHYSNDVNENVLRLVSCFIAPRSSRVGYWSGQQPLWSPVFGVCVCVSVCVCFGQLGSLWRKLLIRCPAELLERQLLPPLALLLDHLLDRLDTRWTALQQGTAVSEDREEEDPEVR